MPKRETIICETPYSSPLKTLNLFACMCSPINDIPENVKFLTEALM